jgi:tRNA A37 threonylcarbamoyladenosine synthetase subunit TsaC/SUA5/YrdC
MVLLRVYFYIDSGDLSNRQASTIIKITDSNTEIIHRVAVVIP